MKLNVKQKRALTLEVIGWLTRNFPKPKKSKPLVTIGFDLSYTATGYVVLEGRKLVAHGTFGTPATYGTNAERNEFLYSSMKALFDTYKPDIVAMEAITVFKNPKSSQMLIYAESMLYKVITDSGKSVPLIRLTTSQVKKAATGGGKGSKANILKDVYINYGENFDDDNEADAYCAAVTAATIPEMLSHFARINHNSVAPEDFDKFMRDFLNGKYYDGKIVPQVVYDLLLGLVSGPSADILKTNDKTAYYEVVNLLKEV